MSPARHKQADVSGGTVGSPAAHCSLGYAGRGTSLTAGLVNRNRVTRNRNPHGRACIPGPATLESGASRLPRRLAHVCFPSFSGHVKASSKSDSVPASCRKPPYTIIEFCSRRTGIFSAIRFRPHLSLSLSRANLPHVPLDLDEPRSDKRCRAITAERQFQAKAEGGGRRVGRHL